MKSYDRGAQRSISDTRLNLCRAVAVASLALLGAALVMFQVLWSDRYVGLALKNRLRLLRLPPVRGQIYDRNGLPLALNTMTFDIMGYPQDLKSGDVKSGFVDALGRVGIPVSPEELDARIKRLYWAPYRAISLVSGLTLLQMTSLMGDPDFPQVLFPMPVWKRIYPAGETASHIVGYVGEISERELRDGPADGGYTGGDDIGKTGIERYYEDVLRGFVGERAIEVDARGAYRRVLGEKAPGVGKDLVLTLDLGAQLYASKLLSGHKGSIVVLDVTNGEVLVMYSNPSFDPNPLSWGISGREWTSLNLDKDLPMLNRAIAGQYSPGSIFKVVTGYAALESGAVGANTQVRCSGAFELGNNTYRCWRRYGHGNEDIVRALRDSCDVFFYETSQKVGVAKYRDVGSRFGLGRPLGIDLPGEASGLLPDPEWKNKTLHRSWYKGDSVNMSIGQGYLLMTPLQMANVYATIANGGTSYRPHLLKDAPVVSQDARLDPTCLRLVRKGLEAVTSKGGTGVHAMVDGADMVGKTGTVQHAHGKDHAVFAAYGPVKSPKYAIVCFLEGGESGGRVAGPLVGSMMAYMQRSR